MQPDELLERIAVSLRHEIGPAVSDSFARTQAFMASVILEKLAAQLRLAEADATAERAAHEALADDLEQLSAAGFPTSGTDRVRDAMRGVRDGGGAELGRVIEALYAERSALGAGLFDTLLGRVRGTLRARLDRQMVYAS